MIIQIANTQEEQRAWQKYIFVYKADQLNWPTISELIKRETTTMVYKSLNGLVPMYLSNIFSRNPTRDTVYLINSKTDLRVLLFKTANGQKSFAYRGAHLWNNLESEVKKHPLICI